MAKYITCSGSGISQNDGITRYWPIQGSSAANTEEVMSEVPVRDAGAFSNAYIKISATTITVSDNCSATLRKSRQDTALVISWPGNTTGYFSDDAHSVDFAATDEVCFKVITANDASGYYNITVSFIGVSFESSTSGRGTSLLVGRITGNINDSEISDYVLPAGRLIESTTESQFAMPMKAAFTGSALYLYVTTNLRTTNTVVTSRKNSGNGNCTITFAGGVTGVLEEASPSSDSFVVDDTFDIQITVGSGTETVNIGNVCYMLTNSSGYTQYICGLTGQVVSSGTYFIHIGSNLETRSASTTESDTQILPQFDFTISNFQAQIVNSGGTGGILRIRDNGSDGNCNVSVASSGLKQDTVNTDEITGGSDEICFCSVTSEDWAARWISFLGYSESDSNFGMTSPLPLWFRS